MVVTANVGRDILTTIRNYGIDTVFGIPGTHNLEFYRHLPELDIRWITTRHEQGAGFGADGWSLQTGLPGVVITTSGPGMLNALGSVANAYAESRPLIVLTPGVPLGEEFADIGSLHETKDSVAAAAAVSEWARRVRSGTEAVQAVHDAFEHFRTGRPRPVVIEVPLNILEGESDCPAELLEAKPAPAPAAGDDQLIQAAAEILAGAERPVILAGGGSVQASAAVLELAQLLDAPVVTSLNGRGVIPETHPLAVGATLRLKAAHRLVNGADALLAIGTKIGEAELWWGPLEPSGKVVRVDRLDSQLDKNLPADVGIRGDSRSIVPALRERLAAQSTFDAARPSHASGADRAAAAREEIERESREWSPEIAGLSDAIAAAIPENVVLGADSSQVCYYGTANHVPLNHPNSYLYMATYATLGYGLPAAIGAKLGAPERPVVAVIGDGALMFSIQELMTASQESLDLVVVCVDNGGYREIEQNEADRGIEPIGVRLVQPNWPQLADAFGWEGSTASSPAEVTESIRRAIAEGGRHFIHVPFAEFESKEIDAA
ncbi:thiamine pyrophosphate-binding protein [Gulosibacter molinativorax]|uniref:thiamine pyrophosphate-binding protein n=1 Tax=Gulosibacter molinativorax TaxID=256821 RepID=UPI0003F4F20B|nr:thiamine pyrophosphate-binding protein [Gulosibacter molinativorax]QUY62902.1 Putative 2-ketoarginine decarboxylase AruI [Gulosibacter molinativorax]